jgi:hypothetical protein
VDGVTTGFVVRFALLVTGIALLDACADDGLADGKRLLDGLLGGEDDAGGITGIGLVAGLELLSAPLVAAEFPPQLTSIIIAPPTPIAKLTRRRNAIFLTCPPLSLTSHFQRIPIYHNGISIANLPEPIMIKRMRIYSLKWMS